MFIRESAEQRPRLIQTVMGVRGGGEGKREWRLTGDWREEDGEKAKEDVAGAHGWRELNAVWGWRVAFVLRQRKFERGLYRMFWVS